MPSVCTHANCPCPPVAGSTLCSYHRCECGREKQSSNDRQCGICAKSIGGAIAPVSRLPAGRVARPGYAPSTGSRPSIPSAPGVVPSVPSGGRTGGCSREGCTLPSEPPTSRFCVHHGCRCGKEKSSRDSVCGMCAGGMKTVAAPKGAGGGAGDKEEEAQKAVMAGLRIDEPKPTDPPFDLDEALGKVVGMRELKENIRDLGHQIRLDMRRGVSDSKPPLHMVFTGNPGTGKTSMARIMARMLHAVGYSKSPRLVEVQRADLVAEYVGQTAVKTKRVIKAAMGGVLFVDEAYRLCSKSGKDFGAEAIEELMAVMTESDVVIVLAGYPEEMQDFIETNPGLFRRIRYTFTFPDYSPVDVAAIMLKYVEKRRFRVDPTIANPQYIGRLFENYTSKFQRERMNGGIVEHVFEGAKKELDRSISHDDPNPSIVLLEPHLIAGMRGVKEPPCPVRKKKTGDDGGPPVAYA